MENYDGTIGSITAAVLKSGLSPTTAVQLVVGTAVICLYVCLYVLKAVKDIGNVAASVFRVNLLSLCTSSTSAFRRIRDHIPTKSFSSWEIF
jgi:hypothetical protein